MVLVAFGVTASGQPGAGLAGGLLLVAALILHGLVLGAAASRRAAPLFAWRFAGALALVSLIGAACAPDWICAPWLAEAGVAAATLAGGALAFNALAARAPTMRDEDW